MRQPPGYPVEGESGKVLLLIKAIYGLKQSGREWYHHLCSILKGLGFERCKVDHAVFIRRTDPPSFLLSHVDDFLLFNVHAEMTRQLKRDLSCHFNITDGGLDFTFDATGNVCSLCHLD